MTVERGDLGERAKRLREIRADLSQCSKDDRENFGTAPEALHKAHRRMHDDMDFLLALLTERDEQAKTIEREQQAHADDIERVEKVSALALAELMVSRSALGDAPTHE